MQKRSSLKLVKVKILPLLFVLGLSSCIPHREIIYFQEHEGRRNYVNPFEPVEAITERYVLRPNDQLFIHVSSSNPKLTEFFNPRHGGQGSIVGHQTTLSQYPIDDNHNIDLPFVGRVNLRGATRSQASEIIREALQPFVADAQVTVRLANPTFTALGEVNSPGQISMGREQVTIFEAIALAGEIGTFGKKRDVKIIRPTCEGTISFRVDLTDKNIVDSNKYFIYPNDIIYVRPMRARALGIGDTFSLGVLTSVVALYLTISALIQ